MENIYQDEDEVCPDILICPITSSIIKELLDNSIDAASNKINISKKKNLLGIIKIILLKLHPI